MVSLRPSERDAAGLLQLRADGIGKGLHAPVVPVAAPVEDEGRYPLLHALAAYQFAHKRGALHVAAVTDGVPDLRAERRAAENGALVPIVDDLRVDVLAAAERAEPRPLRRAFHALADVAVPAYAQSVLLLGLKTFSTLITLSSCLMSSRAAFPKALLSSSFTVIAFISSIFSVIIGACSKT